MILFYQQKSNPAKQAASRRRKHQEIKSIAQGYLVEDLG